MADKPIFDFRNNKCKYKGVLSAIADNEAVDKEMDNPFPTSKKYVTEVIAFIWIDEDGTWIWKGRLKFPSGNKISFGGNCGKNANETKCLHEIYKFPMKEKNWFPNPKETVEGLIEIMKQVSREETLRWERSDRSKRK
jgi:hypothetical protein